MTGEADAFQRLWDWNQAHPVGTPVLAWPVQRAAEPLRTRTRSVAWRLGGGHLVVSVVGYGGGIAVEHVELDPTRQPAVPDVEFPMPPCPMCGQDLDSDGDALVCHHCRAKWSGSGSAGAWYDGDFLRCPATRKAFPITDPEVLEQCVLAADHDVDAHIPGDGYSDPWADNACAAVIDSHGEAIR